MSERAVALRRLIGSEWPQGDRFMARAQSDLAKPFGLGFRALFASVPRRLGELAASSVEVPSSFAGLTRPHWTLTDYVRATLSISALDGLPAESRAGCLLQLFEAGEIGEQVSILRTLPLLPEPDQYLETALQACRTNARVVFEAVVCENPFVAAHFPALNFNQAVFKAIFMEVSVRRIEGLEPRITPELQRMAVDYASERRAAGRGVPVDTEYLIHYGA